MLFSNNLAIDKNLKIPSNKNDYFLISKHWNFSQKIIFNLDNVDIDNLYVIVQSYLWNAQIRTIKLYTFMENKDDAKILSYTNIFLVKKMNLFFFSNWWDNISDYDRQYLTENSIYGIIIVFSPQSLTEFAKKNNIGQEELYIALKPNYPWSDNIVNLLNAFK